MQRKWHGFTGIVWIKQSKMIDLFLVFVHLFMHVSNSKEWNKHRRRLKGRVVLHKKKDILRAVDLIKRSDKKKHRPQFKAFLFLREMSLGFVLCRKSKIQKISSLFFSGILKFNQLIKTCKTQVSYALEKIRVC